MSTKKPGKAAPHRRRPALLVVQSSTATVDEGTTRRLERLVKDVRDDDGLVVVAGPGHAGVPDVATAEIEVHSNARNPFVSDPTLARRLRAEGVGRVIVAGLDDDAVAATCNGAQSAGFAVDRATLRGSADVDDDEWEDDDASAVAAADAATDADEVDTTDAEADTAEAQAGKSAPTSSPQDDAKGDPATKAEPVEEPAPPRHRANELRPASLAERPEPGAHESADGPFKNTADHTPGGPAAEGPVPDGEVIDAPEWDDTWALRGETQPGTEQPEDAPGVRGWLTRKLNEARTKE